MLTLLLMPLWAHAAVLNSSFTLVAGNQWKVEFSVSNVGDPAPISEFTVFFPETFFSNLSIVVSPSGWDPLAVQPDLGIPASGFVDWLAPNVADQIDLGQTHGEFVATFNLLAGQMPFALSYEVYSEGFFLMSSGTTTAVFNPGDPPVVGIPEPSTFALTALACLISMVSAVRRRGGGAKEPFHRPMLSTVRCPVFPEGCIG